MSIYIAKLFSYFLYPLTWVVLLLLLSVISLWWQKQRLAKLSATSSLLLLSVISMPVTSQWLMHQLESRYPVQAINDIQPADVILVLGGGIHGSAPPWRLAPDLNDAADRVVYAAQLYHAGKASRILVSGGTLSWKGVQQSEASAMKALLVQLSVPESAIIEEDKSQSTYENMKNSQPILANLGMQKVMLVTSAAHMPRSMATALHNLPTNISITAATTDIRVVSIGDDLLDYLPQASGLAQFTEAWHEWIGWLIYRLKGYA
ncbi:MAG TPA: YdcF family protein [Thiotrichales bacterium]|nr:MAG: hypothetical protein B7Y68_04810 [Thiotrichales bacterium 35-46-9]HQR95413.1 YdcF family protein [Thiotrichales bacterium]